jgi:hypothetical protein
MIHEDGVHDHHSRHRPQQIQERGLPLQPGQRPVSLHDLGHYAVQEAIRRVRQHERLVAEVLPDLRRRLTVAEGKRPKNDPD